MKTTYDQQTILYHELTGPNCQLKAAITGEISKDGRVDLKKEDVVINSIAVGPADTIQYGTSNVNIYVADIELPNGQHVPNTKRLAALVELAEAVLLEGYTDDGTSFWIAGQTTIAEPDLQPKQHYCNLRIEFQHTNIF